MLKKCFSGPRGEKNCALESSSLGAKQKGGNLFCAPIKQPLSELHSHSAIEVDVICLRLDHSVKWLHSVEEAAHAVNVCIENVS